MCKDAFYHSSSGHNNLKMPIDYCIEIDNASTFPIDFKCPPKGNNIIFLEQTLVKNENCALQFKPLTWEDNSQYLSRDRE